MADELAPEDGALDDIVTSEEGAEPVAAAPLTTDEYAREHGWVPKEEWTGPEDQWRPSTEFLSFGLNRAKDLNKDVKHLRENVDRLTRTQQEQADRAAQRARDEEKKRWEQMLSVAVQEGDEGKAFEATQKIAEISVQPVTKPQDDPLVAQFVTENSWFTSDPEARALAQAVAGRIADAKGAGSVAEQLEEARKAVLKRFPEYAPTPAQPPKVVSVSAPATRLPSSGNRAKGFADLSADQQLAAKYLVQTGKIKSVDAYVAQAFNSEGTIE